MSAPPAWPARFVVPAAKITAYLLDPAHVRGGPKARFFMDRGFDPGRPEQLASALLATAVRSGLVRTEPTAHGLKPIFEGRIETPADPRTARVRTVWLVAADAATAALVTAIPR